jgi:hypothetical protein
MLSAQLSHHASVRANQRGVPHALMDALIAHADLEVPVGKGCVALSLSRRRLDDRELREKLGADLDRLGGLSVVCSDDSGEVVTVLHDWGRQGRRYRGRA